MLKANIEALKEKGLYNVVENSSPVKEFRVVDGELYYKDMVLDKKLEIPDVKLKPMDTIILYGFGYGNALSSLRERYPDHVIVVLEREPYILKLTLENRDLSKLIRDPKVIISLVKRGEESRVAETLVKLLSVRLNWGKVVEAVAHNYSRADFYDFESIKNALDKEITPIELNRNTMILRSRNVAENVIRNIPDMAEGDSLEALSDIFKGKPAVIIASGPSLSKNIELVKEHQDKACIIAVDSVLSTVYEYGIVPDFVCGVDYQYLNEFKYSPILKGKKKSDMVFISSDGVFHSIPKLFNVAFFSTTGLSFSNLYSDLVTKADKKRFSVNAVTHMALQLAYVIGANPIIFVGQDWAYSGGMDHAKGASVEMDLPGNVIWVKGNYEEKVPTDPNLFSGLKLTENIIKATTGEGFKYINATEGGAYIEGTEIMRFSEVAKAYLKETLNKSAIHVKPHSAGKLIERYRAFQTRTEEISKKLAEIVKKASRALAMDNDVIKRWERNRSVREIKNKVDMVNAINDEITFDETFNRAVSNFFFKEFYYFNQEEIDIKGQDVKKRIEQSIKYFKLIKEKTSAVKRYVDELVEFLSLKREYLEKGGKFVRNIDKTLKLAEACFRFKAIYDGLALIDEALNFYPDNANLYYWQAKLKGLNRFMHKEALESYRKALELSPDFKKALFDYNVEKNMVTSHLILAKQALEKGDYVGAKRLVNRALDYEPENKEVKHWIEVMDELAKVSKDMKRQKLLLEQLQLQDDVFEEYKKAIELVRQERFDEAHDYLVKLYDKYGALGDIPFLLGSIYVDRKELDKAEKYLKEALELIPYQPLVYLALGKLYLLKEDYYSAKENLEKAISMNPSLKPGVIDTLGNLYYQFGEYEKAFHAFNEYLKYSDDKLTTLTKIAHCYRAMGMINEYNMLMEKINELKRSN